MHPKQTQSISITSPVCQIRICIAFCKSEIISAQTELQGKSKEGGRSPLLGRFKGDCQGGRVPTRIQRSDSCGKRRNNGTDDACPPQAADRMRDVEFVPTQLPLDYSFFRPSTALSFSYEKESGVENVSFLTSQKKVCRRRHPAPFRRIRNVPPEAASIWKNTTSLDMASLRPCGRADNRR